MGANPTVRLGTGLVAFALALLVYLAAPPAPRAQSSSDPLCNLYNTGNVCKEHESCLNLLFYRQCSKQIWRQPLQGDFGNHPDEPEDEPVLV